MLQNFFNLFLFGIGLIPAISKSQNFMGFRNLEDRDVLRRERSEKKKDLWGEDGWPNFPLYESFEVSSSVLNFQESWPRKSTTLWRPKNEWSLEWERRFSNWIQENVDETFFLRHQIPVDCADVAYALRWIFARIYSLPAANRLPGTQLVFSSLQIPGRFQNLATAENWQQDLRFRAALSYLLSHTYTISLFRDSYPVSLNADGISPGSFYIDIYQDSGHVDFLYRRGQESEGLPFFIFSSTTPRDLRVLATGFLWAAKPAEKKSGLFRMQWAQDNQLLRPELSPLFSKEQYAQSYEEHFEFPLHLIKKLNPHFDLKKAYEKALENLSSLLERRKVVVRKGWEACGEERSSFCYPESSLYSEWSTPLRDERLVASYYSLKNLQKHCGEGCESEPLNFWEYQTGIFFNLEFVMKAFLWGIASNDPRVSEAERWGLEPEIFLKWIKYKLQIRIDEREKLRRENRTVPGVEEGIQLHVDYLRDYLRLAPGVWTQKIQQLSKETFLLLPSENLPSSFESVSLWEAYLKDFEKELL